MPTKPRVFVFGIDGGTLDLVRPWVEAGELPNFKRFLDSGTAGDLTAAMPPITGPSWTSFYTGVNPGKHGIFDFVRRARGEYRMMPVNASYVDGEKLWTILSKAGKKVCVLNAPLSYPPEPVNGLFVTGMMTPPAAKDYTQPPGFAQDLAQNIPGYEIWPAEMFHPMGNEKALLESAKWLVGLRRKAMSLMAEREPDWDLFFLVFSATDIVCHALWHGMDATHPRHDPAAPAWLKNAVLDIYREVDVVLGEVLDRWGEDALCVIMSDHGFGPLDGYLHVNSWLHSNGWLKLKGGARGAVKRTAFAANVTPVAIYRLAFKLGMGKRVGRTVRARKGLVQSVLDKLFVGFDDVDWAHTRAYSLGNVGPIYVNLRGREPNGIVEPGEEYEGVVTAIERSLRAMKHPKTGAPLIEKVHRKAEIYWGEHFDEAPDLMFFPKDLRYCAYGDVNFASKSWFAPPHDGRSGFHRMNGIVALHGPGVRPQAPLGAASIVDLTPTILAALHVPIPSYMDGRVLQEAFTDDYNTAHRPLYAESELTAASEVQEFSAEDEEEVAKRLEDLGYLG